MRLYNTLGGRKEELQTLVPHRVGIYVCGPTTYNYIHLGNARPLVVFDTVRRYLKYRGYDVTYVQNFTDVDDKIINRAREQGEDPVALGERYIEEYFRDADALNISRADVHPRVSQHMEEIVSVIDKLIEKGYAYPVDGDVFYRVRAFQGYGKLSGRSLEDMQAGARVEVDSRKEDPMDFALWKAAKEGEPWWNSPWGKGRPGWHIECSVMSTKYLGNSFDIHGGGSDLVFPHHENEIAQSEALTGQPFAKYWMHNGFITVNNEKMSKSLGNFFILRDILAQYPADVIRFYLISTHYRSPLDFDDGKLEEARKALGRLKNTLALADEFSGDTDKAHEHFRGAEEVFLNQVYSLEQQFIEAMDDDFNTARAIGYLFDMARVINTYLGAADRNNFQNQAAVREARKVFYQLGDVLGIFINKEAAMEENAGEILQMLAVWRVEARRDRDYQLADQLRDFLQEQGVQLEDTAQGTRVRYETPPQVAVLVKALLDWRVKLRGDKQYQRADQVRDRLQAAGIIIEDTREGARWKFADTR